MREFLRALLYVVITQVVCWGIFVLCDEFPLLHRYNAELLALIVGLISAVIIFVLYLVFIKKIIKKYELNSKLFNIFLIVLWIFISILSLICFTSLVDEGVLHVCKAGGWACFLNGIEYVGYGLLLVIVAILIIILKVLSGIYGFFKKKFEEKI